MNKVLECHRNVYCIKYASVDKALSLSVYVTYPNQFVYNVRHQDVKNYYDGQLDYINKCIADIKNDFDYKE